jgi:hypothetical protein
MVVASISVPERVKVGEAIRFRVDSGFSSDGPP